MNLEVPVKTDVLVEEADSLALGDEKLDSLAKSLGMIGLPGNMMRELRDLGCAVNGLGVVSVVQGAAMHTEGNILLAINRLMEKSKDADKNEMRQIIHALGYIAHKRAINHKVLLETAIPAKEDAREQKNHSRQSFKPGEVITPPSVTVNIAPGSQVTVQESTPPKTLPEGTKPA